MSEKQMFKNIIYLAASGLNCSIMDLLLQRTDSLVATPRLKELHHADSLIVAQGIQNMQSQ